MERRGLRWRGAGLRPARAVCLRRRPEDPPGRRTGGAACRLRPSSPRPSTFGSNAKARCACCTVHAPGRSDCIRYGYWRSCAHRGSVGVRGSMLHQQRFSRSLSCMRAWASRKLSASCCSLMVYRRCRSWVRRYSSRAAAMTGASLAVMLMRIYGITSPPGGLYIVARLAARGPIERRPGSNKAQPRRPCVSG